MRVMLSSFRKELWKPSMQIMHATKWDNVDGHLIPLQETSQVAIVIAFDFCWGKQHGLSTSNMSPCIGL